VEDYGLNERIDPLYYRSVYESMVGGERSGILLLAGAVSLVVLVACANVANLLLARSFNRRAEISMRAALGASRSRLVRQLLAESGVLALCGGTLGVLAALGGLPALLSLAPLYFAPARNIDIDLRVLGFALLLSLLTSVLFGLAPATMIRDFDLKESLAGAGAGTSGTRRGRRVLNALVVAEIALALVLLVGTGLFVRTFLELRPTSPGFDPDAKLVFELRPPQQRYPDAASLRHFYDTVLAELRALPGADAGAAISTPPLVGMVWPRPAVPEGTNPASEGLPTIWFETASANYHEFMDIAIRRGRGLEDRPTGLPEMVISERAARSLWPEGDPLGKRVTLPDPFQEGANQDFVVVGVAADTRRLGGSTVPRPTVWVRYQDAIAPGSGISRLTFLVQARGRPEELAGSIRELIARLDPELPVLDLQTMDQILYDSTGSPRFYMVLMSTFGGIAILLAAVGFYGVMAYAVGRRTHELGVRVALGASTARIRWMVVRQGALITTIGIGLGLAGCVALAGVLESFLYGISPTDPLTYGVLVVVVAVVGLLACYVPARRATRVDPSIALRDHP
jgi:putative ABC transport system permease protein